MQTFLPLPDFAQSLKCLDKVRLGKQRVEASQILTILIQNSQNGWSNHPAVNMWRGYTDALIAYYNATLAEFATRRKKNGQFCRNILLQPIPISREIVYPYWLGDSKFHEAHRSNLLRKNFAYYSQFGWTEPTDLPYVWPKVK